VEGKCRDHSDVSLGTGRRKVGHALRISTDNQLRLDPESSLVIDALFVRKSISRQLPLDEFHPIGCFLHGNSRQRSCILILELKNDRSVSDFFGTAALPIHQIQTRIDISEQEVKVFLENVKIIRR
jgi:hypothetical protein